MFTMLMKITYTGYPQNFFPDIFFNRFERRSITFSDTDCTVTESGLQPVKHGE